jgi:energy-coupling factor transport system permease protein
MLFPYKNTSSRIHGLDARTKIVFVFAVFVSSILLSDILYLSVLLAFVLIVSAVARTLKSTWSLLRYAAFVAVFVILFNVLLSSGRDVLFMLGPIAVTSESILFSISMCLRLLLAVSAFALLTFAIHPDEALRTMSKVGYKTMTALSLSTRMYPTIAADSRNIMDSMRARGVEFDRGGFFSKLRARANVVMPLLFNSLDRSIAIAEAMEARGFGAGKRTNYSEARLSRGQKWMVAFFVFSVIVGIALFVFGYGNADYLNGAGFEYGFGDVIVLTTYIVLLSPILIGGGE